MHSSHSKADAEADKDGKKDVAVDSMRPRTESELQAADEADAKNAKLSDEEKFKRALKRRRRMLIFAAPFKPRELTY